MRFAYKAISPAGRMQQGQLDAANAVDLEMRLKRLHLELVSGHPVKVRAIFRGRRIPRPELINFCFHLEQLALAGVPIIDGLADLRDSVVHPHFRDVLAGLIESVEGGRTVSQAMDAYPEIFRQVFVNLIRAGETSGQLPAVLASLAESLKWEDELAAHTKKLLLYPAFVATIVLGATVFLMIYMVPQLKLFVKNMGQSLPAATQLLFWLSDLLVAAWPILLLLPMLALAGGHLLLRASPRARLRLDEMKLHLPLVGPILKKIILSRFANTFAMLYAAGTPILESLRSTRQIVGNQAIEQALADVEQAIRDGCQVASAFADVGLFPPLVIRMLRIGETTGGLDRALLNVSYFYTRDIKEAVGKAQALIEPTLTLFMGLLLGWIMLAVIGPIYDVISTIKT